MIAIQASKQKSKQKNKQTKKNKQQKQTMQQVNVYMYSDIFAKNFIQHRYYESIFTSMFLYSL